MQRLAWSLVKWVRQRLYLMGVVELGYDEAKRQADIDKLESGGTVIVNSDAFEDRNLAKAGYDANPLEDGSLDGYTLVTAPMTSLTKEACKDLGVKPRDAERSKNFFALGLVSWLYSRPEEPTMLWIQEKFKGRDLVIAANEAAYRAGNAFGETAELSASRMTVRPAELPPGEYTFHLRARSASGMSRPKVATRMELLAG